jgi:hypothetical protein
VSVTFPSTLKKVGAGAFYECTELREVSGADGKIEYGADAFLKNSRRILVTFSRELAGMYLLKIDNSVLYLAVIFAFLFHFRTFRTFQRQHFSLLSITFHHYQILAGVLYDLIQNRCLVLLAFYIYA